MGWIWSLNANGTTNNEVDVACFGWVVGDIKVEVVCPFLGTRLGELPCKVDLGGVYFPRSVWLHIIWWMPLYVVLIWNEIYSQSAERYRLRRQLSDLCQFGIWTQMAQLQIEDPERVVVRFRHG